MMIAASRNERGLRTSALHQLETKHTAIERERPVDVGNFRCTRPMRTPGSIGVPLI